MADQGTVSTADTPKDRPANVITSETEHFKENTPAASSGSNKPDDQTPGKSATSDDNEQGGKTSKRNNNSAKRRIDRLTRENSELRAKADQATTLQAQLDAANSELAELKQTSHKQSKPKRADFESDEEFADAYYDWKSEADQPPKKQEPAKKPEPKQPPADNPYQEQINDIVESGEDRYDDWDTIWKKAPINQHMAEVLFEIEDPDLAADVVAYLHEHRKDAEKLFKDSETSARKAIKGMDDIIDKAKEAQAKKPDDKTNDDPANSGNNQPPRSEPPAPANHLNTGSGGSIDTEITGKESMDDYAAKRLKQEKSRRRP